MRNVWQWIKNGTTSTDWLIVILTAVIAVTSYLQWHEIRAGSTDTHTLAVAAKDQADKMSDMADAADKIRMAAEGQVAETKKIVENSQKAIEASNRQSKDALDATINTSRNDQRAWVSVVNVQLTKPYSTTENGEVTITLTNTGKTPAVDAEMPKGGFSSGPDFTPPPTIGNSHLIISPGNGNDQMFLSTPLLEAGTKVYLRFEIEYRDVFQKSTDQPHSTTFCGYYPSTRPQFFFNCDGRSTMN